MNVPLDPPSAPPGQAVLDEACGLLMRHWAAGNRVPVEYLLSESPALADDPAAVFELVVLESNLREDIGDPAPLAELVLRFPALADSLRLHVAFRDGLRQAAAPDGAANTNSRVRFSINGYEVGRVIGSGGMATVYEARQLSLNRRVALKMISGGLVTGDHHRARLTTEAEAVSRLQQHPNVVQIYEVGIHDRQPFLALELVEGGTLADRLRAGPLPAREAAELIETVARAVHAVHSHGIVHRDIKPANILFTRPADAADRGIPKLGDFGLAKLADGLGNPTRTGETLGTPAYMAPEQVTNSRDVGPATDVYGLGAVLYECLTGQPPFRSENAAEAVFRLSQHDPVPPSRLRPGLPQDLQTICLKCLEKNPRRRYRSAADLADELGRFVRSEPVRTQPLGPAGRAWKVARRRPLVAALLLGLVTSVLAGLVLVTWKWREADRRATGEASERENAETNLYRSRVSQAALLWQSNNVAAAKELLAACVPGEGQPDHRGWEWNYLSRLVEPEAATITQRAWVRQLAVSPDGRELAAACGTPTPRKGEREPALGELVLLDLRTREPVWRPPAGGESVAVAYSPDGQLLAAANVTGSVRVFHRAARKQLFVWEEGAGQIGFCFSPDNRHLAILTGSPSRRLVVRDLETGEEVADRQVGGGNGPCPGPVYSPDGRWIVTAGPDVTLRLWNPVTRQEQVVGDEVNVQAAAFLGPDRLVTVGESGGAIWDLTAPKVEPRRLFGHAGVACAVAVSPDGTAVATGGTDHTVRVWDAKTAREVLVLRGHTWTVRTVAFTPDGRWVVSGGQDGTVKVWDAAQKPRGQLDRSAGWVNAVAFTPDGRVRCQPRQ